jgi:uncharacterized protein
VPFPAVDLVFYSLVLIGAFAVRGAAGFGAGLVAVPLLALFLPVTTTVSVATVLTTLAALGQISRRWRQIAWGEFCLMSFYTAVGIAFGFYFLKLCNETTLRHALGVFLILYSIYALYTGGSAPVITARWRRMLAACTGSAGGFLAAVFGGGVGPIYVTYFNSIGLSRDVFRVTMSTTMLVGGAARIAGYASYGFYRGPAATLVAIGVPLVVMGSWLGDRIAHNVNPRVFGALIGLLVLMSGIVLLLK